jgi:hypothetical protein
MRHARVAAFGSVLLVACVSDPVKKQPGTSGVTASGTAGTTAGPSGGGGTSPAPAGGGTAADPTGAAGTAADPAGAAGTAADPTGTAGMPVDPTGVAGTSGASGAAGSSSAAGTSGVVDAGPTDAGQATTPEVGPPPITDPCDHRAWVFTPSVICTTTCAAMADSMKLPANAIDANTTTRYTTGITQGSKGPEVAILTFPKPVTLAGINLLSKNGDGPMSYLVESSLDGANFSYFNPGAMGAGSDNLTVTFPAPTKLLALRITQTGVKKTNWWSIHELTVMGCAAAP